MKCTSSIFRIACICVHDRKVATFLGPCILSARKRGAVSAVNSRCTCEALGVAARGLPTTHFVWAPSRKAGDAAKRQQKWHSHQLIQVFTGKECLTRGCFQNLQRFLHSSCYFVGANEAPTVATSSMSRRQMLPTHRSNMVQLYWTKEVGGRETVDSWGKWQYLSHESHEAVQCTHLGACLSWHIDARSLSSLGSK